MRTDEENRNFGTTNYPELGIGPISAEPYYSAEYFEREKSSIFSKVWLNVCREEELPQANDFVTFYVPSNKASVLIVRGDDGKVRAFYNLCSHRGNKVVWESKGSSKAFACRYHGWAYRSDGTLASVPDAGGFFELDRGQLGLTPIRADIWGGFVFINFDAAGAESLSDYLAEVGDQLKGFPFAKYSAWSRFTAELRVNWKTAIDAFQETYHVRFLHKRSLGDSLTGPENPFCHCGWAQVYDRHRTMSVYGNPKYCPTPTEALAYQFGPSATKGNIGQEQAGINPGRLPAWAFDAHHIFPNCVMGISAETYFTHQFWPIAVDRTAWVVTNYHAPAMNAGQMFNQQYSDTQLRDILLEDAITLEHAQEAIGSGGKQSFILHDQELLIRHMYNVVEGYVRKGGNSARPRLLHKQ
ncbi:MAG: aromatic ring-hydroxylating dioxygenase subunit alpha [Candidatus Binataceae bacterium]|nr:aromatic ring-hydroxylating dioxygenase subunit alpha [Candidatus Binataceae bacterium]